MDGERALIVGDEYPSVRLTPKKDVGIGRPFREFWDVADADDVEPIGVSRVVAVSGLPDLSGEVFIEEEAERHGQDAWARRFTSMRARNSERSGPCFGSCARRRSISASSSRTYVSTSAWLSR